VTSGLSHETRHKIYKYFRKLVLARNKGTLGILRGWIWGWGAGGQQRDTEGLLLKVLPQA